MLRMERAFQNPPQVWREWRPWRRGSIFRISLLYKQLFFKHHLPLISAPFPLLESFITSCLPREVDVERGFTPELSSLNWSRSVELFTSLES